MSTAEVRRWRNRCDEARLASWRDTANELRPHIEVPFRVNGWSRGAAEAYRNQWLTRERRVDWDWEEIFSRFRDPGALHVTIWGEGDQLCGIGVATMSKTTLFQHYLEARPGDDNSLGSQIALIFNDVVDRYGQKMGRSETRCCPLNDEVAAHFRDNLGFNLVTPRKGAPYYVRSYEDD